MAHENGHSAAELEREVEAQRAQVETTIGEIKERLTPGQLVDELLSHIKQGGSDFATNLGQTISANPLPAALLGVSIAWLMAGPKPNSGSSAGHTSRNGGAHRAPSYMAIRGSSMQRIGHAHDELSGDWYSEFTDDAGAKYRARADESGKRMGHFVDEAGKEIGGFLDEAGSRIEEFRDEAGSRLDDTLDWANHAWQDATRAASQTLSGITHSAADLGGDVKRNATQLSRDAARLLEDQPLVMGALAFAAGAALGAVLPHTPKEDSLMGEAADKVKREAGHLASDLYDDGKKQAGEVYKQASAAAGEIYSDARNKLAGDSTGLAST